MIHLFYAISFFLVSFKTNVTRVQAFTHRYGTPFHQDASFLPKFFPHVPADHIYNNVQISLPYHKKLYEVVNNDTSHITKPLYLKAKENKDLQKNTTDIANYFTEKTHTTFPNNAKNFHPNLHFSNDKPVLNEFSNPVDMFLLKLNQKRLFSQGENTVNKTKFKGIIKHSNGRREKRAKTSVTSVTKRDKLFDIPLSKTTKYSNHNRSISKHKNYTRNVPSYQSHTLNSTTHSNTLRTEAIHQNYPQNTSHKQNNMNHAANNDTFNHHGITEYRSGSGHGFTTMQYNNNSTSNVRKPVPHAYTPSNNFYKNNTLANSFKVGNDSWRMNDLHHILSNCALKNGSLSMHPCLRNNRSDNTKTLLNDELEIFLLRSEQKRKKFSPTERVKKSVEWLKLWINSQKEPIYFERSLLKKLESRGIELRKQVRLTPAHRAALTTDIQQAGKLLLTMSRRQNKKRVLKTGTIAALLYLANLNSQGYTVDMTFESVSFKQRDFWRRIYHENIRKVLFETLLELIEELTVPRTENFPSEFSKISMISKMRLLRSLAPSLCRLRRSTFDPITGECIMVQDQAQCSIILPASPFYDNHGLEDTNFFSLQ
ncbi:GATA zinc finger domain-containing protein 14-like isoform X2 [Hylaeus volcanicus]|uniref:GATA zinc finger domain-containing protein 14-like isoform X2 n=1 Tax=Hylaeus volcanicus TaxID=313075 RepID=UPI0023B774EB|nr:GATA zinc finger domain-containing protein 14-like isoform X2 [Hylaeus volcanicus]